MVGLEAGQKIPIHTEGLAQFQFLEGKGVMVVDGKRLQVGPGTVIITQEGTPRGIEAETQLKFMTVRITEFAYWVFSVAPMLLHCLRICNNDTVRFCPRSYFMWLADFLAHNVFHLYVTNH